MPLAKVTSVTRDMASVTIDDARDGLYGYFASNDAKYTGSLANSGVWELSTAVIGKAAPP